MLRSGAEQGRPVRRLVLLRHHVHRHLLPAQLPGAGGQAPERALLRHGRRRPTSGLPCLHALPARRHARLTRVERPRRRRGAGHAPHRRRRRRPRRCRRSRGASRLQHPPAQPPRHGRSRHRTSRRGPRPPVPDRAHLARDDRPVRDPHRVRGGVLQRAAVQRHHPAGVRRHPRRPARPGRQEPWGGGIVEGPGAPSPGHGVGNGSRRVARGTRDLTAAPVPAPVRSACRARIPRCPRPTGRGVHRGRLLPAQPAAPARPRSGHPASTGGRTARPT